LHNLENGDYTAAEREYRNVIATEPLQPYLYYNLGLLLHRMNRRADAKVAYQRALDIYSKTVSELRVRATEWRNDLPLESALAAKRAGVYEKRSSEVLNARGALMETAHDMKNARTDYQNTLSIDPDLCPARDNLAALQERELNAETRAPFHLMPRSNLTRIWIALPHRPFFPRC
jgi:tetratricopeptide (TPR) repeat protein